ncbi:MAG: hypothetical protein L3J39_02590 [Verrucomicrobiales bacterium]|nr:hypothetical protein [Verrucomicrobiales bacterium]
MSSSEEMQQRSQSSFEGGRRGKIKCVAKRVVRHALFPMLALVVFSLIVDETYPFSDFPMYSKMNPYTDYYILEDGEGQPLPVKYCFGLSASAMKKMYVKRLKKVASAKSKELGRRIGGSEIPAEEQKIIGDDLLDYLLPRGEKSDWWKKNKPDTIKLVRVKIERSDKLGLMETPTVVVERRLKVAE